MADPGLIRLLRGFTLHALYSNVPNPLAEKLLYRQCKMVYPLDAKDFARTTAYLEQAGHITSTSSTIAGVSVTSFSLTASGMRLAERIDTDPAVEFDELD